MLVRLEVLVVALKAAVAHVAEVVLGLWDGSVDFIGGWVFHFQFLNSSLVAVSGMGFFCSHLSKLLII